MKIKQPALTTDTVILMDGKIVLIRRKNEPFRGKWALPGGFVDYGERVEDAAVREAKEETSLDVELTGLLGVYSAPDRDPRGHTVGVVYLAKPVGGELKAADDAAEIRLVSPEEPVDLAFDHGRIFTDAVDAMRKIGMLPAG